ncbi:(deoxy)nucleoside triphosphate pyrophosphohydrolase [Flavobacterium sp. RSSA_27]|uniref:(deoxy)nucleoside triphosphate pyrophosphohydrolase n=1 Tax=Flavobacterium sp. RSSA_27 TaxID=3447667 RepID=UPI003F2F64CC
MKFVEVVAAVIIHDDKILCVQRGVNKYDYISMKYEFPGGKLEKGETRVDCIKREIFEELNMDIDVKDEFLTVKHEYPDFIIEMHSFICNVSTSELVLTEHVDFKWLKKTDLNKLDWAEADIPIVNKLMNNG